MLKTFIVADNHKILIRSSIIVQYDKKDDLPID